jgi:hypothetical protein
MKIPWRVAAIEKRARGHESYDDCYTITIVHMLRKLLVTTEITLRLAS